MKPKTLNVLVAVVLCSAQVFAGDRESVLRTLEQIPAGWTDAHLDAGLMGGEGGEIPLDRVYKVRYSASAPGYVSLVHVTSHGAITVMRGTSGPAVESGVTDSFKAVPPLGTETLYILFSRTPLERLFPSGQSDVSLGDSPQDASRFLARLRELAPSTDVASKMIQYMVVARGGQTQYTTRGIVRDLTAMAEEKTEGVASTKSFPTQIQFEFNSDRITPQGKLDLDVFGEAMMQERFKSLPVRLEGHTDDVGTDEYNLRLSQRRSEAVQRYFTESFGMPASRFDVAGFGKMRPLVPNTSDAARAKNRRVEFVFVDQ